MAWMKVTVPDTVDVSEYDRIQGLFEAAFMAAGGPEGAALFTNSLMNARKTGTCIFYFSPDAGRIFSETLKSLNAETCAAPEPSDKPILLVGTGDAFKLLA
jgi:hypothetical protein